MIWTDSERDGRETEFDENDALALAETMASSDVGPISAMAGEAKKEAGSRVQSAAAKRILISNVHSRSREVVPYLFRSVTKSRVI